MDELIQVLTEGKQLQEKGSRESRYLIQFPYVWLERYPWQPEQSRICDPNLNSEQKRQIEKKLPDFLLNAQVVNSHQFLELIEFLYLRSQDELPQEQRKPFSEAIAEDIKQRLIASETVTLIDSSSGAYYALTRASYSPVDQQERTCAVAEDTAQYFRLMKDWSDRRPIAMRLLEELDILPEQIESAMQELDELIRTWADKYHNDKGQAMIFQAAFGLQED